jgi:hypothetical protein
VARNSNASALEFLRKTHTKYETERDFLPRQFNLANLCWELCCFEFVGELVGKIKKRVGVIAKFFLVEATVMQLHQFSELE